MSKPRLIAFYLPQFYPTPENDEWWSKGFTEWTNVGRAKPLFKGHYQPRVPADLGYYDLRIPDVREQQAELAKQAGIEGFCYWHYWFAGTRLLDQVFKEVVESGKPDFPFCLCWANHSWYKKIWDPKSPGKDKLLIEQTYPGVEDFVAHFNAMLPAFKDKRYIKVNGKILFGLFAPLDLPDCQVFFDTWNDLAKENGLEGFYFFGLGHKYGEEEIAFKKGFDAFCIDGGDAGREHTIWGRFMWKVIRKFTKIPRLTKYDTYCNNMISRFIPKDKVLPCILPNFDHSPRSEHYGVIFTESTPDKWKKLCLDIFKKTSFRNHEENIVIIKSWNEWGEGNYLEPDMKFGIEYIKATRDAIENFERD